MSVDRVKGCVAYHCDLPGCDEGLETGERDFAVARDTAKNEGWVTRNREGVWMNFCCVAHEEMQWRGQSLVGARP